MADIDVNSRTAGRAVFRYAAWWVRDAPARTTIVVVLSGPILATAIPFSLARHELVHALAQCGIVLVSLVVFLEPWRSFRRSLRASDGRRKSDVPPWIDAPGA